MPGQMPEMLSRGKNLQQLDAELVVAKQAAAHTALLGVGDPNDLAQEPSLRAKFLALTSAMGVFAGSDLTHFEKDWLNGDWWPNAHPIAPVLVLGFRRALEIAIQRKLDIETLWVCTPPSDPGTDFDTGLVHVGITWSKSVVTVVIYTPKLPEQANAGTPNPAVVIRYEDGTKSKLIENIPS